MACAVSEPDPRGDFPAWLATRGMKPTFADAMERELGISDYEELLACAEDAQVTAELLGAARDRLPFAFYAVLRRLVRALAPRGQRRRWWMRPRGRRRERGPLTSDGEDDEDDHEEEDEELGGCAAPRCEGVVASRAVLDAIVATLSSLSRELLQSAQKFRRLEPALVAEVVTRMPPMCDGAGRTRGYCSRPYQSTAISTEAEFDSPAVDEASPGFREDCFDVAQIKKDPYEEAELVPDAGHLGSDCMGQTLSAVLAAPRLKQEEEAAAAAFENSESPPGAGEWEEDAWPTQGNAEWDHNPEDTAAILPQPPTDTPVYPDYPDYTAKPWAAGRRCTPADRPYGQHRTPPAPARASRVANAINTAGLAFACGTCNLAFETWACVQAHAAHAHPARAHAGPAAVRAFSCEVCGKAFTLRCNLYRHKQTHAADKPFECSSCGRRFSKRMHLRVHFSAMHKAAASAAQGTVAAEVESASVPPGEHGRNGHPALSGYGHRAPSNEKHAALLFQDRHV